MPNFNWSKINPTIYGSVFETLFTSTNSEKTSADKKRQLEEEQTQREGGIHFTTVSNIHKVIDNLFLNDLYAEFNSCKKNPEKLLALQDKIANLKFFDPACGSGNFLTESYISLRRLENKILQELGDGDIKVSINQFFGIEINNFAVELAKLALWISELQMAKETAEILGKKINPLPLKNFANIFEGNALTLDWQNICPQADYIFGNPPFVGTKYQTPQQKQDILNLCKDLKPTNSLKIFLFVALFFPPILSRRANKSLLFGIFYLRTLIFVTELLNGKAILSTKPLFIVSLSPFLLLTILNKNVFSMVMKKFLLKTLTVICKTLRIFTLKKENRLFVMFRL